MLAAMKKWLPMAIGMGVAVWLVFKPDPNAESETVLEAVPKVAPEAVVVPNSPSARSTTPTSTSPIPSGQLRKAQGPELLAAKSPQEEPPPGPQVVGIVLRDSQGALPKVGQKDAARACSSRGMHLPSIRELARLGKYRGAKGILEVSQFRREDESEGYVLVEATNLNGTKDFFYYSPKGYIPSAGETSETAFWSSSFCVGCVISGSEEYGNNSSFSFYGNGQIQDHYDHLNFAIRCVGTQKQ